MNENLKELLENLNLTIDVQKIIGFIDGSLNKMDYNEVKKIISNNPELATKIDYFKKDIENSKLISPPNSVHKNLMRKLGIKENNIFDISLKLIQNGVDIITGKDLLVQNFGSPAFRGNSNDELMFEKNFYNFKIVCYFNKISSYELSIYFKLLPNKNENMQNIQLKIFDAEKIKKSIITNEFGTTNIVNLKKGDYKISIIKGELLGEIHINLTD